MEPAAENSCRGCYGQLYPEEGQWVSCTEGRALHEADKEAIQTTKKICDQKLRRQLDADILNKRKD